MSTLNNRMLIESHELETLIACKPTNLTIFNATLTRADMNPT